MKLTAAQFKAKCLSLLDRVHERGESVTITKRGKVVARLVPAGDTEERPWLRVGPYGPLARGRARAGGRGIRDRRAAMSRPPLLDTHAWVWWVDRDRRLGRPTIDALDALPVDAESDGVGLVRRRELDRGAQTARAAELSR